MLTLLCDKMFQLCADMSGVLTPLLVTGGHPLQYITILSLIISVIVLLQGDTATHRGEEDDSGNIS